jgi:murein DD-endopeptidase MepM/ murein hydrolase activator NlpD
MADLALAIRIAAEDYASDKLKDVERAMGGVGSAASAAKTLLPGVAGATAGLTAALGASVGVAAEFEKTMDGALAVMSPSDVQAFSGSLENLALRLGKDTSFSAKEAAAGIEELIKGGLTAQDVLDGAAESTLALAAAGGVSLPDAATIAANALAQFNLKGTDMAHVSDLIAGAANASAIDVNQFKFSLQAAGAVAAVTGFSFDDLAAGIALMGKNGIAGSDAGTSLKTMFMSLQPATAKAREEFAKLGLTTTNQARVLEILNNYGIQPVSDSLTDQMHQLQMAVTGWNGLGTMTKQQAEAWNEAQGELDLMSNAFFTSEGRVKSMSEVAGVLQKSLEGMTEQQKLASLEVLFGSDAIRAGAILAKEGAEGFNDMAAAMGEVAAVDVAKARLDNLNGSMEAMSGSIETVGITIGKILIPAANEIVKAFTNVLNAFLNLSPEVQKFIAIGAVVAAGLGVLATVALTVVAILPTLVAGFAAVSVIAGAVGAVLAGPVVLALGAVVLAAAALALAWNTNFLGIQGIVQTFWDYVSPIFGMVADALNTFSREVAPEASAAWTNLTAIAQTVWQGFIDYFTPVFADFKKVWDLAWPAIQVVATAAFTTIDTVIRTLWELLKGFILTALKILQGDWGGAWEEMKKAVENAWKIIDDRVRDVLPKLATFIGEKWDEAGKKHNEIWGSPDGLIVRTMREAWDNMTGAIGTAIENILKELGRLAEEAFNKAKEIGSRIIDGIKEAIGQAADGLKNALRDVVQNAINGANSLIDSWKPKLPSISMPSLPGRGGPVGSDAPIPAIEDSGSWVTPLRGVITQEFGKTPYSSIYPGGVHTGIDIAAAHGAAVVAARTGVVDIAGWDTSGYGNLVAIRHPGGFRTLYGHLSDISVRPGQSVISGQVIGREGSTGNSSGPHLHFEVRDNGATRNPRSFVGFHTGGVIPGPLGANVPVLAHGGEVVLRPDQAQAMGLMARRGMGGSSMGMDDDSMRRMAGYIAAAVASAMANMSVRMSGSGFSDAVVGAISDGARRGRLSPETAEAYAVR